MSVPADQLPQGQTFTDDDFASAMQPAPASAPPSGTLTDADFDSALGAQPPQQKQQPSLLDKIGEGLKQHFTSTPEQGAALAAETKDFGKKASVTTGDIKNIGEIGAKDWASLANATADWVSKIPANLRDVYAGAAMDRINKQADLLKAQGKWTPELAHAQDRAVRQYMLARGQNAQTNQSIEDTMQFGGTSEDLAKSAEEQANETLSPEAAQATLGATNAIYNLALIGITPGGEEREGAEALNEVGEKLPWLKNSVKRIGKFLTNEAPGALQKGSFASANEGATTYHEVLENGGSPAQAARSGVTAAALQEAQIMVPAGMRGQLLRRILVGAGYSGAISAPNTIAMNAVLPKAMQAKVTPVSLSINAALGAAMAGIFGKSELSAAAVKGMYDNLADTAANNPDPEKRASATRVLAHANQFAHVTGGASEQAILAATYGEEQRQQVMDAPHADLYGANDAYTRAYDSAQGQFKDDAARQQYAKGIAAADTAMNAGWKEFMGLRGVIDDGLKDYQAAGQMPDIMDHAKRILSPDVFNDLQDFLTTGSQPNPDQDTPAWLQTGSSPQFARDTILKTLETGKLPPEAQQTLDARRARQAQFAKLFPNVNPETGEPLTPEATAETPAAPKQEAAPKPAEPAPAAPQSPQEALANYFTANPYPRSNEVMGYAALVPQEIQQQMADWAPSHSPMEVESAYREAATTGQLPAEVAIHETEGRTEPAESAAEQDQAGLRSTQAEAQPETQEGVAGNGGREPAGNEGRAATASEPGNVNGNAEAAEEHAENAAVTPRAVPVQAALADAGVATEEAAVGPKGDIRIAQDASPEAAQKALDVAAADTGASNTEFPEPTAGQASAGNYRKGGVTFKSDEGDLKVKIENPDGSVRSGEWGSRPLKGVHYGYFPDTVSADGHPLDVLMTHDAHDASRPIAFIRQHDTTTGKFDELKVVMGARSRNEALQAYWRQYPRDLHLKLTPNGSQDVVMMKRPKALAFIKSGSVDVPPHPVSGKPMLMLRQTVPVEFDSRSGNMGGVRDILDKLAKKHDLSSIGEDAGVYRGEVPRSAVPDLQRGLEKNNVELEIQSGKARRVAGRVAEKAGVQGVAGKARVSDADRADGLSGLLGRKARRVPAQRSPTPEGVKFVKSDAPVFEEGVNGRIGKHPVSVVGVHYSPIEGLTELDPAEAGTGSAGGERRRFGMGNFGRGGDPMARQAWFYVKEGARVPEKEQAVSGSNQYEAVLNNLYDIKADPDGIFKEAEAGGYAQNRDRILEEIHNHGYDGILAARPEPGQKSRPALVYGINGKIPVKELAAQYEEPAPKRMASEMKRVRDKFTELAKQAKDEAEKRTKITMFQLPSVAEHGARIHFEYAPSPDFKNVTSHFDRMNPETQRYVSERINEAMGPDAAAGLFGKHAPVKEGLGGYLGKISPSYSVEYKDTPLEDVLKHAQDLADAYNQQSVMVLDDRLPEKATELDIRFDGADDPEKVRKFWTALRAKVGDDVIGFSQIDGGIGILNAALKPEEAGPWLDKIKQAVMEISNNDGVTYNAEVTHSGYKFVGGNYDRYLEALHGTAGSTDQERAINSLQIGSYNAIRRGIQWGTERDQHAAEGLVAPGVSGIQKRADSIRAVARLTRGKPRLVEIREAEAQVAGVEQRYAGDLKANSDGTPLPSPKGVPSKLTRDQWVQTRTPNFLRWGGDWLHDPEHADVLLDETTGEPQVFYHETDPRNEAPILAHGFRYDTPGSRYNDYRSPTGTFFKPNESTIGVGDGTKDAFSLQMPMFLRMRNPLVVHDKDELIERMGGDIAERYKAAMDSFGKMEAEYGAKMEQAAKTGSQLAMRAAQQFGSRIEESFEGPSLENQKAIHDELKAQGHDGVIIDQDRGRTGTVKTYITLNPNDSKSASRNVGTFSERPGAMFRNPFTGNETGRLRDITEAANKLVDQFGDNKPKVVVHFSRAKASPEAKAALKEALGESNVTPPAMYLDGKLHIFADANRTPEQLEQAVMHEMVHYGLRKVFGDDLNPLLDDIWKNAQNDDGFKQTLLAYRNAYRGRPDFQRNVAEEYVAHLAETQSNPSAWRKVVDWFRAWGRKHGFVHDWTDDDIRGLIRSVYSDLKEGRTSVAGIPAARTMVDFKAGTQTTEYRGAADGNFIEDEDGNWRFQNKDVDADMTRSLVDGEKALNADPKAISAQGIRDLAKLAGEERSVLTLPDTVPKQLIELAGVPSSTHNGMHVLRPESSESPMYALRNSVLADPATQALIDQKIGYDHAPTSPWEWMQSHLRSFHFRDLANDAKSYWLDAGAYIDLMERKLNKGLLFDAVTSPYKMYWLSRNVRQIAMAVMRHGVPEWTPTGYNFREGTKGLMDIWKPMMQTVDGKNLMDLYGSYKIGVRAKRLLHEFNPDGTPKEKLFSEDEADQLIALGAKYPQFKTAFVEEQKFLKELQDFAVERGALDPKTAEAWQKNAYVPFRRIIDGKLTVSNDERRGVNDKITSKRIRGAEYALKDPNKALVDNVIRMLDHVYNNDAKRRVMALGELSGAVKRLPLNFAPARLTVVDAMNAMRKAGIEVDRSGLDPEDLRKIMTIFHPVAPRDNNIESTVEGGKLVYWQVNDGRLLQAIHDMRAVNSALTDKFIKLAAKPAQWVRWGVTMSPKFMVKIMFKDMVNTFGQTGTNPNMLKHLWTNAARILSNDKFIDQLRLNGFNGNEYYKVDDVRDYVRQLGGKGSILGNVRKAYLAYRRTGWVSEQLSRTRIAEHMLDRGHSMAEAAWQGQNTLNWQKHGYGMAAKLLMRAVPFMNAHLQGMVRIYDGMVGRDVLTNRNRAIMSFFIKSMAMAIPSMVLEAENQQNKDYQRLPDYMKDAYWNFYIGGRHFMLPKPFEWGAMAGTMPQRSLRVATGQDSSREFWKAVYDTLTNDVIMLPIPAAIQEPLEQYANKDFRTGLPIESEAMQNQQPADRSNGSTTLASKRIGGAMGASPVRLQHFVNGYFSSVGMYALQMMSGIMRATGHFPAKPAARGGSWVMEQLEAPFGGAKASTETGNQYLSDFYDAQAIADKVAGSVHINATRGEYGRAQQLAEDNPLAFRGHHELQVISVQLARLRKQERMVESSQYLTAQQKRTQMNAINDAQKRLLDRYEPFFRAILDGKKQVETEQ